MPTHLRISTSHAEGATVVHVGGEVDMASAPELEAAVTAAVELDGAGASAESTAAAPRREDPTGHELILDLRAVTFLASAGLKELLKGARLAANRRLRMRVIASDCVLRVVEVAAIPPTTLAVVPATTWRAPAVEP
ncbi:STAS domain-containing protein [Actinospica durhamensis]|uniref:STAS domain-containing protein n=1 Tax=Actinospica durhamensis TaxID=1508375 RepID=A0A941ISH3_9ACTN|nr:STAS domain-containing protein [Actinospica durhamensis]MBR7836367.1 STAS domain-containing protein [Actinospica durhamensis]